MSSYNNSSLHSPAEETANMLTHAVGVVAFLVGSVALLVKAYSFHDAIGIAGAWIFCISLVTLYTASTLYHYVTNTSLKEKFQLIDHCAIFGLIAGTYSPFLMVSLRHEIHFSYLIIMWAIAVVGVVYKLFMIKKYRLLSTFIYLAMGWMAVFKITEFYKFLPGHAFSWIIAGGLSYTLGTIFYSKEKLPYGHAIWHLLVLGGSTCHFIAIYFYIY